MNFVYLTGLLISLIGICVIDFRFKLAFARAPKQSALVLAISVLFFVFWDLAGIALGIFFRGSGPFLSGLLLAPELPIEELFFLLLLNYTTLVVYLGFRKLRSPK